MLHFRSNIASYAAVHEYASGQHLQEKSPVVQCHNSIYQTWIHCHTGSTAGSLDIFGDTFGAITVFNTSTGNSTNVAASEALSARLFFVAVSVAELFIFPFLLM